MKTMQILFHHFNVKNNQIFDHCTNQIILYILYTLFGLLAIFSIIAVTPSAFADHMSVTVTNAPGSSVPGCEETAEGCFIPSMVTLDVGGEVTWENNDTAAHTVTSGSATDGPDGVFDSSLITVSYTHYLVYSQFFQL